MRVTIYGAGYVGLVQAAVFADVGHDVLCVDVNAEKLHQIERGNLPMYEPNLSALITKHCQTGRLRFSAQLLDGVTHGLWQFVAVGTPSLPDGHADISAVASVVSCLATYMTEDKILVHKSTVPVGTADKMKVLAEQILAKRGQSCCLSVASNPEFLKEGSAVNDCRKPDRIIVGTEDPALQHAFSILYAPFNRNHDKLIFMDICSAELTKYAANALLATKISFMNELASLADKVGGDIESVRKGIGSDPRLGHHFLYAGCGYGGACFPKDLRALTALAKEFESPTPLLTAVETVNEEQKHKLLQLLVDHFHGSLSGKTVAVWGLAFKPNTSDVREAPSLCLIGALLSLGVTVKAFDPQAIEVFKMYFPASEQMQFSTDKESAVMAADALVICTEWSDFWSPNFSLLKQCLREPVIVDGRNIFDPELARAEGFVYYGIGRR